MLEMAKQLARLVSVNNNRGFMILPEITVTGTTRDGSTIIGRLDLLLVDTQGRVSIFDFKTKKVKNLVQMDPIGQPVTDVNLAFVDLAGTSFAVSNKEGTAPAFRGQGRTAYDTWTLQLKVYENILKQGGLDVRDQSIVALMYQTDSNKKFLGSAVHVFDEDNYYSYAGSASIPNNSGHWVSDPTRGQDLIKSFRKIVDTEIPTEETIEEERAQKEAKLLEFEPSKENNEQLKISLVQSVENELDEINKKISELDQNKSNPALREIYATRRSTLNNFRAILTRMSSEELGYSVNFSYAIESAQEDLTKLAASSAEAMNTFKTNKDSFTSKEGLQITEAYKKSRSLSSVVEVLTQIVREARENPENNITPDSDVMKKLSDMSSALAGIEANFAKVAMWNSVQVLQTPGVKTFADVNADVKEVLEARLIVLKKKYEDLKQGKASSIFQGMKSSMLSFVSKDYKQKIADKLGAIGTEQMTEVEKIEREILSIEAIIDGALNYDAEALEKYISGVTNSASNIYLGSNNIFNSNSWLSHLLLDDKIASVSNGSIEIAALTMMLKNAEGQARLEIQNSLSVLEFDQKRDKLLQRMSVEELNDKVSEYREFLDPETGEPMVDKETGLPKETLYMVKPFGKEYENTYRQFSIKLRLLNKEIYKAQQNYTEKFNTPEKDEAEKLLISKRAERDETNKEYIRWMLENAHLPFTEKFYQLQLQMPEEIRDELQKKYLEIETITYQVGKGNEVLLDEADFDRLQELEIEIRKLRVDAKRKNPEYAKYLDEFNDLFEFDTNDAFFQRMRFNAQTKYEQDHPAEWEKWKKTNEVSKPTSEWYEELSALYEARAEIFGSDPEIAELMQQRRDLLSPYKIGGRIKPQFLNQADIDALSDIDAKLETIIESKTNSGLKLTADEKKASREITDQINKISSLQLSESYNDTFELKLKSLLATQRSVLEAENSLAVARTTGDKKVIEEAEKDVIFYEEEFEKAEVQFEAWYNMHHDNKYVSINTGYDIRNNRVPKNYNFEKLPALTVRDKYMETVPHPKYKIKRLKESAKNQDFLKSPDGIPMPKAISLDSQGNYIVTPGYENSNNLNSKYKELMKDKELLSFYNDTMKMFFELQMKTEGRKIGYKVPGFAASTVENIARKGVTGSFNAEWQKFIDKNVKEFGEQDGVENTFGNLGATLRNRFTEQLSANLQTKDAIGAIIKYTTEAHYNIAMQQVAPQTDMYIEHLEYMSKKLGENIQQGKDMVVKDAAGNDVKIDMSKRKKELDNVIGILKFERRKFMYGQAESTEAISRKATKIINSVFAYTSFVRIGFDVANQMKNYISGNVQAFIAAGGMESDKYTREDFLWAKGKVYGYKGFLHEYIADWGRVNDVSDSTMLYRYFNPAQKDFLKYVSEVTGSKGRRLKGKLLNVQELGYMLQDKGDTEIAVTVMYAVMNHHKFRVIDKYDAQGNPVYKLDEQGNPVMVPVHEIYIKDAQGRLTKRQDVEYTQDDENRVRNIIYSEMRRAQGNYAKADMTKFEEGVAGKLVFFFRKYLVPQFLNRFGYLRPNWEASEGAIGYWRAVAVAYRSFGAKEVAKHFVLGSRRMSKKNTNQMGNFLTRKVGQARRDSILMAIMVALGYTALQFVRKKDDDDEELSMLEGNAIRILWGVQGETLSMFPVGGGSSEYIRNFTTLTTYTRELEALKKLGSHGISYGLAMAINGGEEPDPAFDSPIYQDIWKEAFYGRKYGAYEKGDAKVAKDLMDLSGIKNFRDLINPNYRIDQMKARQ
jgi:hypothetical protein